MPNFKAHLTVASVSSGLFLNYAMPLTMAPSSIAFALAAGTAGGLIPDLDCPTSRPRRLAITAAATIAATWLFTTLTTVGLGGKAPLALPVAGVASILGFLFVALGLELLLRAYADHRGLFHSLPAALIYAGIVAHLALANLWADPKVVWLLSFLGVLSHLLLDAIFSCTLNPLKLYSKDYKTSIFLWFIAGLLNFTLWA